MSDYFLAFKKIFTYDGRATRTNYWMFTLVECFVVFSVMFIKVSVESGIVTAVAFSVVIAHFLASYAVTVRRFHDQNLTGCLALLQFIPGIGYLIVLIFMCLEGTRGENQYGPSPYVESGDGHGADAASDDVPAHAEPVLKITPSENAASDSKPNESQPNGNTSESAPAAVKTVRRSTFFIALLLAAAAMLFSGGYSSALKKELEAKKAGNAALQKEHDALLYQSRIWQSKYLQSKEVSDFYDERARLVVPDESPDKLYHRHGCSQIGDAESCYILDQISAREAGYSPCPICCAAERQG